MATTHAIDIYRVSPLAQRKRDVQFITVVLHHHKAVFIVENETVAISHLGCFCSWPPASYMFWAEVAEKHTFFRRKWLKNVRFSGGSGWKIYVFRAEAAEKHTFFSRWQRKNIRFSGRTGWKTYVFRAELAEKRTFFGWSGWKTYVFRAELAEKHTKLTTIERFFSSGFSRDFRTEISCFVPILRKIPVEWTNQNHKKRPQKPPPWPVAVDTILLTEAQRHHRHPLPTCQPRPTCYCTIKNSIFTQQSAWKASPWHFFSRVGKEWCVTATKRQ